MDKIKRLLKSLVDVNLFENFLPIFRVYLSFHIIKKIFLNWDSLTLFLDKAVYTSKYAHILPYIVGNTIGTIPIIVIITIILALLFGLGIGKNITALLLFFSMLLYFEPFLFIANGGDNLLYFILIYMIFTNSYKHLTITHRYRQNAVSNFVSNLASISIMLHLCLIYFVSGVHKIHADVWLNGVATYYILQLERFNSPINGYFTSNTFLIAFSTYYTLLFEMLFPFLVWNRRLRPIFLISGVLMHLGIYFTMMIYDFEILFIVIYGFFIPNEVWQKWFDKAKGTRIFSYLQMSLK